jgi:hypothetical protein
MTSALWYKEFRESVGIAALALVAFVVIALSSMRMSPIAFLAERRGDSIPFVNDSFAERFTLASAALALALGFFQSLGDFRGDGHLFLLHRPISRRSIYLAKLAVGLVTYLLCGLVPIVIYSAWAATPGTHPSPFAWSMTAIVWSTWLAMTVVYLGAFLSGIRPAAWLGSRLAPLAAAAAMMSVTMIAPILLRPLLIAVIDLALAASILRIIESRDFS